MKTETTTSALYMHITTGSVDTFGGWVGSATEGTTEADIRKCIAEGSLVEVVKDEEGDWVAAD